MTIKEFITPNGMDLDFTESNKQVNIKSNHATASTGLTPLVVTTEASFDSAAQHGTFSALNYGSVFAMGAFINMSGASASIGSTISNSNGATIDNNLAQVYNDGAVENYVLLSLNDTSGVVNEGSVLLASNVGTLSGTMAPTAASVAHISNDTTGVVGVGAGIATIQNDNTTEDAPLLIFRNSNTASTTGPDIQFTNRTTTPDLVTAGLWYESGDINFYDGSVTNLLITDVQTDISGAGWVLDEDTLSSDSATKVPTQQSVKAYVDTEKLSRTVVSSGASTYTVLATDDVILLDGSSNTVTADLPTASGITGKVYTFTAIDVSFAVDINPNGTEQINLGGAGTNYSLGAQWDHITLISDGTNWVQIG